MKRKSFVINLYGVFRKAIYILTAMVIAIISFHLGIPGYITGKMADKVFAEAPDTSEEMLSTLFSLDGKTVIENMFFYETTPEIQNTKPVAETQTKPTEEKKEEIPAPVPNTPAVDFSKEKPANASVENSIIVSNTPKKQFNISELLARPLEFTKTDGYKVLIIHTHTTESYLPDDRNDDPKKNMIRVGEEFTNILNKNGIKTLHCKTVHDIPYSKSYINELKSIEKILAEHPSIEVIIDVHRDALYNSKNEKLRPVTQIKGEDAAQVMLVCGTNASGLSHETWQSCFSFALKVQDNMNKNYPNLARPINLRTERFNTHMTKNSVIFEIGSNGNALFEALNGAKYAAQAISDVLNGE